MIAQEVNPLMWVMSPEDRLNINYLLEAKKEKGGWRLVLHAAQYPVKVDALKGVVIKQPVWESNKPIPNLEYTVKCLTEARTIYDPAFTMIGRHLRVSIMEPFRSFPVKHTGATIH